MPQVHQRVVRRGDPQRDIAQPKKTGSPRVKMAPAAESVDVILETDCNHVTRQSGYGSPSDKRYLDVNRAAREPVCGKT